MRTKNTATAFTDRIEALRESDPEVDALITDLKRQLTGGDNAASATVAIDEHYFSAGLSQADLEDLVEPISAFGLRVQLRGEHERRTKIGRRRNVGVNRRIWQTERSANERQAAKGLHVQCAKT